MNCEYEQIQVKLTKMQNKISDPVHTVSTGDPVSTVSTVPTVPTVSTVNVESRCDTCKDTGIEIVGSKLQPKIDPVFWRKAICEFGPNMFVMNEGNLPKMPYKTRQDWLSKLSEFEKTRQDWLKLSEFEKIKCEEENSKIINYLSGISHRADDDHYWFDKMIQLAQRKQEKQEE